MATYKTPGVFIEEISTLGSSIAGVPTAIPGFVGYTEKAIIDGTPWTYPSSAPAPPVRITSLLEYQQIFGGPFSETFTATLTGAVPSPTTISVIPTSVVIPTPLPAISKMSSYILFYQVQMFYANGGGTCYIVSAAKYPSIATNIAVGPLSDGISKFEQIDEVTLLATPEAVFLSGSNRKTVYDKMATQCAKLQDRFAILDVVHDATNTIFQDATAFRNSQIGADNLKYAAAYYPALNTPTIYSYKDGDVLISDLRTPGLTPPNNYTYSSPNNKLSIIQNGAFSEEDFAVTNSQYVISPPASADTFKLNVGTLITLTPVTTAANENQFEIGADVFVGTQNLVNAINAHSVLSTFVTAVNTSTLPSSPSFKIIAKQQGTNGDYAFIGTATQYAPNTGNLSGGVPADKALYNSIKTELDKYTITLYPSGAMAGIYARVDADRGVWKAPANVGLALVNEPSIQITDDDQENLNVDSVSGKSINAIRAFTGRGTLVWGARTLAGNDNEWRYVNVRRLFIYVEESCKKATEFVVFEANTANTWQRVQGMMEAFLTGLWRDGALAGATPKDAFFVRVGLGTTMTAQDILEGKMIVEIGMAAARPAEFIILRFSHKLQES
jgi:phage tail sheath protein FI